MKMRDFESQSVKRLINQSINISISCILGCMMSYIAIYFLREWAALQVRVFHTEMRYSAGFFACLSRCDMRVMYIFLPGPPDAFVICLQLFKT